MLEDFSTMKSLERWYTWSIFFEWSTTSRYPCPNIRTGWMVHSWLIRSITHTRRQHTWGVQVLPTTEDLYLPLHLLLIWSMSYYNFMDRDDWGPKICQALPQNKVSQNLPKHETAAQTHHMNPRYSAFPKFPGLWEMVELQQKWTLPEALKGKLEKCRPWWYSPTASNTPHASSPACFRGVSLHGLIPQLRKIKKFQKLNPDLAGLVHKELRVLFRSKSWFQCLAELFLRMKPSWPHRPIASSFKPKHTGRLPCLHWATNCPFHLGKPMESLCYDDPMLHQLANSSTPVPRTCCLQWSSHVAPPKEMPRKFSKVSKHCFKKNMQFGWKKGLFKMLWIYSIYMCIYVVIF